MVAGVLVAASGTLAGSLLVSSRPNSSQTPGWQIIAETNQGRSTDDLLYSTYNRGVPDMRDKGWEEPRVSAKGREGDSL